MKIDLCDDPLTRMKSDLCDDFIAWMRSDVCDDFIIIMNEVWLMWCSYHMTEEWFML